MSTEVRVPALPESVADATVLTWYKRPGEPVEKDETLVDLETDKVVLEVPAPESGVLAEQRVAEGEVVEEDALLATIEAGAAAARIAARAERRRRPPRTARTHDPAARAHRRAPGGGAAALRHADHLQRGGYERGHGPALAIQGPLRADPRRAARLHVVLRQGQRRGAAALPGGQRLVDEGDIVYHGYYDIGIAVSSPRGLVVPILRNCDQLPWPTSSAASSASAPRRRTASLSFEELTGGTFSITNGGVFGSLLSTPILNPPQSAILGMHKIQERPVAVDGQVVIRPMMYLALATTTASSTAARRCSSWSRSRRPWKTRRGCCCESE
jgi:2-oxoglutarate dehydrogenase E2 component (dihydrolipoamide succinyltransferase)